MILLFEMAPRAFTVSPLHTAANDGALTPCSLKIVEVFPTSTVYVVPPDAKVKVPAAPDRPQVLVPFTDATVPETCWGRGGTTVT
jgi:hypothetical protein